MDSSEDDDETMHLFRCDSSSDEERLPPRNLFFRPTSTSLISPSSISSSSSVILPVEEEEPDMPCAVVENNFENLVYFKPDNTPVLNEMIVHLRRMIANAESGSSVAEGPSNDMKYLYDNVVKYMNQFYYYFYTPKNTSPFMHFVVENGFPETVFETIFKMRYDFAGLKFPLYTRALKKKRKRDDGQAEESPALTWQIKMNALENIWSASPKRNIVEKTIFDPSRKPGFQRLEQGSHCFEYYNYWQGLPYFVKDIDDWGRKYMLNIEELTSMLLSLVKDRETRKIKKQFDFGKDYRSYVTADDRGREMSGNSVTCLKINVDDRVPDPIDHLHSALPPNNTEMQPYYKKDIDPKPVYVQMSVARAFARMTRQKIFDHVFHVLANGKWDSFKYIMNWLAWKLRYPEKIPEVAMTFTGTQGSGKTEFFECFYSKLFGRAAKTVTKNDNLTNKFGLFSLKNTVFLYADEIDFNTNEGSYLKKLITQSQVAMEGKGQNTYDQENNMGFVFTSNNPTPLPLESGSNRRYVLFSVGDRYVHLNEKYHGPFREWFKNEHALIVATRFFLDWFEAMPPTWTPSSERVITEEMRYNSDARLKFTNIVQDWWRDAITNRCWGICNSQIPDPYRNPSFPPIELSKPDPHYPSWVCTNVPIQEMFEAFQTYEISLTKKATKKTKMEFIHDIKNFIPHKNSGLLLDEKKDQRWTFAGFKKSEKIYEDLTKMVK